MMAEGLQQSASLDIREMLPSPQRSNHVSRATSQPGSGEIGEVDFRDFVENGAIPLHGVGPDGTILWANQAELSMLGYSKDEYVGHHIASFHADQPVIDDILSRLTKGETLRNYAARLRCKDGSTRHVLISSNVRFDDSEFVHTRCFTRDVTIEKQNEILLSGQTRVLEQIAKSFPLSVILQTLTEVVEEYSELNVAVSILLLDDDGKLRHGAAPSLPEAFNRAIDGIGVGASATCCGAAAHSKAVTVVADINSDPLWVDYGDLAASHDLRACWAAPILSDAGDVLGTFSLYYKQPHVPTPQERLLVETLTSTASIAIERKKAEEALRKSERRLHEILEALPAAVYTTDAEGRITMFNKAATEFSGRVPALGTDSWCVSWKMYDLDGAPLPHEQCPMAIALKESRPVRGSYAIAERPDGSRLKFAPYPTPLYDDSGKLKGAVNMLVDLTGQGIAEESLRVSEERLRAILNSSAIGVALVTPESRFLQVNSAFSMITGYSEQELLGVDCAFLTAPCYHEAMRENIDLLIAGRIPTFVMEKQYCRKDGRLIWVQTSVSMTRDSQGKPQHLVALCQDIDERKQAETVIQSRTAQFETLLQEAPLGVYLIDSDFLIREVNPKAAVIFGNTSPIGRDFADVMGDLWAGAEAQEIVQRFRHTLETGEPYNSPEYASRRLDSEYYEWQINRIMLPEGRFGVVCYFRDISGHVLARKAIRDSEEKLRFMAESMPQKIFAANPSGEVIYFNQQWTLFTGLSFEQIEKWGWTQFIHSDDVEENVRLWKHSVATGEPFEFTHRFRRSDGVYRWHLSRAQAMRDASGAISLWIGSNTEIHEQKDIEENLRLANNDLEQFAFSASHDLREPIRNISIYGQILKKSYSQFLDEQGQQYLDFMTRGAGRLDVLLKDLLAYTQSGAQVADEKVWTEAEIGLNKAISALSEAIKEAGAAVTHDPLPTVRLPEVQIHQLFQNLIGNAIKYRRDDVAPTVHVSAAQRGSFTVFSISDNGIGIAPDYKEKIFGIFKRLHNDAKYTGSGIGLAICQKIVERNGGRIWMESEGEGHGSTFHFTLPN